MRALRFCLAVTGLTQLGRELAKGLEIDMERAESRLGQPPRQIVMSIWNRKH